MDDVTLFRDVAIEGVLLSPWPSVTSANIQNEVVLFLLLYHVVKLLPMRTYSQAQIGCNIWEAVVIARTIKHDLKRDRERNDDHVNKPAVHHIVLLELSKKYPSQW
jgi:hypothetical protein